MDYTTQYGQQQGAQYPHGGTPNNYQQPQPNQQWQQQQYYGQQQPYYPPSGNNNGCMKIGLIIGAILLLLLIGGGTLVYFLFFRDKGGHDGNDGNDGRIVPDTTMVADSTGINIRDIEGGDEGNEGEDGNEGFEGNEGFDGSENNPNTGDGGDYIPSIPGGNDNGPDDNDGWSRDGIPPTTQGQPVGNVNGKTYRGESLTSLARRLKFPVTSENRAPGETIKYVSEDGMFIAHFTLVRPARSSEDMMTGEVIDSHDGSKVRFRLAMCGNSIYRCTQHTPASGATVYVYCGRNGDEVLFNSDGYITRFTNRGVVNW